MYAVLLLISVVIRAVIFLGMIFLPVPPESCLDRV